jgi:hypothetical protein
MPLESKRRQNTINNVTRIAAMRIIFTRIGCTLLTCDMYMSDLRHIHDPVISSLKMEGISFFLFPHSCLSLKAEMWRKRASLALSATDKYCISDVHIYTFNKSRDL